MGGETPRLGPWREILRRKTGGMFLKRQEELQGAKRLRCRNHYYMGWDDLETPSP